MGYERYVTIPWFWLPSETSVNPQIIADYKYPGSIGGTYTHIEYMKAAR